MALSEPAPVCAIHDARYYAVLCCTAQLSRPPLNISTHHSVPLSTQILAVNTSKRSRARQALNAELQSESQTALTDRVSAKRVPKAGPKSLNEKSIAVGEREREREGGGREREKEFYNTEDVRKFSSLGKVVIFYTAKRSIEKVQIEVM